MNATTRRQDVRHAPPIDPECLCEHDRIDRPGRLPTLIRIRNRTCPVPHRTDTRGTR